VVQQHCKDQEQELENKTRPHVGAKVMNEQLGFPQKRKHSCKHALRTGAVNN